jgi:hypothetical protein
MKFYVKVALFVVLVIAVGGIFAGLYYYNLKSADLAKAKPDFILAATDLQKAFDNDEKAASAKYINKIIEVSGRIASIKPAENGALNISLETESAMSSVIGTFPKVSDPSLFKTGEQITFRGQCSGFLMDVLLNNCAPVQNKK